MDFTEIPLDFEDSPVNVETPSSPAFESLSESNIIPRVGTFLGLDISKDSTGVCLYCNGERISANISIEGYDKSDPLGEAKARMSLQKDLESLFSMSDNYKSFDLIIIEDVFEGVNPATTRLLYALNTAIDELILWGRVACKNFVRVSNQTWKSWLYVVDSSGDLKGLNDKVKVQRILEQLGIVDSGAGFQDRLDATGMLMGYFLNQASANPSSSAERKPSVRVQFSDISYAFEDDEDLIKLQALGENDGTITVFIEDSKISKKKMIDYLSSNLEVVFITRKPIMLGFLAGELNIPIYQGQSGFFGFWLKNRALNKYRKRLGEVPKQ